MRLLITGAAGFIGFRLAQAAAEAGHQVHCLDALRGDPSTVELRSQRLDALRELGPVSTHDLATDPLTEAIAWTDAVIHLAGATGVRTSFGAGLTDTIRDNVTATGRLAEACAGGPRLVFASSSSVYGTIEEQADESAALLPISPYGASKVGAESLIRAAAASQDLEAVILRYFTVFGPGQRPDMAVARFLAAARAHEPLPILGDGTQVRSYTYVDDVVRATLLAAETPQAAGETINIAGDESVTTEQLALEVADVMGADPRLHHGPAALGDVRRTSANCAKAAELLGWRPQTSLREGLVAQAEER